ncbi:MAG: hypothetical protein ACRYFZ_10265 [Janthinobacterium lividum]
MLDKFPGLLGYGGIIAIHADWPIYPKGSGWEVALKTLGNFPLDTKFYQVDDIDRCKLLININPKSIADPFNYDNYHAAIWHEDLVELHNMNFVSGVLVQTDYEFEMARFEKLKKEFNAKENEDGDLIFYFEKDGKMKDLVYSRPAYDEEDVFYSKSCAIIEGEISLTKDGIAALLDMVKSIQYTSEVTDLVNPILEIKKYDTAIREA